MKSIFFTGKGGVGKSTLAATAAYQLAEQGNKVLAVSFDPAHNLGDIFGLELSHKKQKFGKNLFLQETDLDKAAAEYIEKNINILNQIYSYTKAFNLDLYFKVLKHSPGVEEYAALTAMETIFSQDSGYDYIVFDTPPTGLTLRILALPNITITWVDRLKRIRKQILEKRHTIHSLTGKYNEEGFVLPYKEEDDGVMKTLNDLWQRYLAVYKTLKGPNNKIAVVFNPDYLSFRETERIVEGLKDLQIPLAFGFNNKFTDELTEAADEVEAKIRAKSKDIVIHRVPLHPPMKEGAYKIGYDVASKFL